LIGAPLLAGAVNVTRSAPGPDLVTEGFAAAAGEPTAIGADAAETGLVPRAFVAEMVQRYAVFVGSPLIVIGAAVAPACVAVSDAPPLAGVHFAVYFVIAEPWFAGAVYVTRNEPVAPGAGPDWTCGAVGRAGGAGMVTLFEGADSRPAPAPLFPATVNVYVVPGVNPFIVTLVAGGAASAFFPPGDAVTT